MRKRIYMDNAATTRMDEEVFAAMRPFFMENFANPAAVCGPAQSAAAAVESARDRIAEMLGAEPSEIYFTSGGTEADNWAVRGMAEKARKEGLGNHLITSKIEHPAVLRTCEMLERDGFEVTYLDVNEYGRVDPEQLEAAIRPDTFLISIMAANNEIGTVEPASEIGRIARKHGICFHTDAVQAFGHIPLNVNTLNADLLSASGHKFGGPKGAGFLYMRRGTALPPLLYGGSQEHGRRAGTADVPGIVGMGKAAELAGDHMEERMKKEIGLRDEMAGRILSEIPGARLDGAPMLPRPGAERGFTGARPDGHPFERLPGNLHFCFLGARTEAVLLLLDQAGICASGGSACTSGSLEPSHVLKAIGVPEDTARCALRLTLSYDNTEEEAEIVCRALESIVRQIRGSA